MLTSCISYFCFQYSMLRPSLHAPTQTTDNTDSHMPLTNCSFLLNLESLFMHQWFSMCSCILTLVYTTTVGVLMWLLNVWNEFSTTNIIVIHWETMQTFFFSFFLQQNKWLHLSKTQFIFCYIICCIHLKIISSCVGRYELTLTHPFSLESANL